MSKESSKKILGIHGSFLLLTLLLLFHIMNNLVILRKDNTPLLWDGGDYFYKSLRYYDVIKNVDSNFIARFNDVSRYRPPFFLLTSLPFYLIFGRTPDVAIMTNIMVNKASIQSPGLQVSILPRHVMHRT